MFDHLISAVAADYIPELLEGRGDFTTLERVSTAQTLGAKLQTTDWVASLVGEDERIITEAQEKHVAGVFTNIILQDPSAKDKILEMEVPAEIRMAVSMVTAYQWKFIDQAEDLRSMAVAKIVKETDHPDAKVRLKALELLGKVTEVALFTERVKIDAPKVTDEDLDARIKDKLHRFMGVTDVQAMEKVDDLDEIQIKRITADQNLVSKPNDPNQDERFMSPEDEKKVENEVKDGDKLTP